MIYSIIVLNVFVIMYTVKRRCSTSTQVGSSYLARKDASAQVGNCVKSYNRSLCTEFSGKKVRYDELLVNYLSDHQRTLDWLMDYGLVAKERVCPLCNFKMNLVQTYDRKDKFKWECRHVLNGKRHRSECSIRKDSFFAESNLSIAEILKFTYWWSQDLNQNQIRTQLGLGASASVDWDMFCEELCEVVIMKASPWEVMVKLFKLMNLRSVSVNTIKDIM